MLFDYVFLWHPSLVPLYQAAGHPKVFAFPHAADEILFRTSSVGTDRSLDLGWVGCISDYAHYNKRRRIIEGLFAQFKMNDFMRRYSKEETADIYKESKIVVNVSRQDFPQDANLRCYETMAAGALLSLPECSTELTEWGFREGEHFLRLARRVRNSRHWLTIIFITKRKAVEIRPRRTGAYHQGFHIPEVQGQDDYHP